MGMSRDRKTEIVTEKIVEALDELRKQYGQEITLKFEADYGTGYIGIRVNA